MSTTDPILKETNTAIAAFKSLSQSSSVLLSGVLLLKWIHLHSGRILRNVEEYCRVVMASEIVRGSDGNEW